MKYSFLLLSLATTAFYICLEAPASFAVNQLKIRKDFLPNTNLLAQQNVQFSMERQCKNPITLGGMSGMQAVAQEALAACDRALANSPNNTSVLQNRAKALEVLGRYEEAIATWDRLVAIAPNQGWQRNRANAVRELQRWSGWYSNRPIRVSDTWVKALTEALRLTIVSQPSRDPPGVLVDPVYSDWKVPPRPIALWSRNCTKRVVLPEQFAANPALARSIIECFVRVILNEEYYQSGNNELEAVRRAAAMYRYSRPDYNSIPFMADFSQRVLNVYRQLRSNSSPRRR